MCVYGGSAVPQGGVGGGCHLVTVPQGVVGDRHLVTVPQGVVGDRHLVTVPQGGVGDRLPWGGERQGGGGYLGTFPVIIAPIKRPPVNKNDPEAFGNCWQSWKKSYEIRSAA